MTLTDVNIYNFELEYKDGYLATNSLILDAVLVARAYEELDRHGDDIPEAIDDLELDGRSISVWLESAIDFAEKAAKSRSVIVLRSPALKPVATDLESKLSEAALLHCQVADLRSFAHGRHSWLTERAGENPVLALVDPSSARLWRETHALIPREIDTLTLNLAGSRPRDLLSGLIAELKLVSLFAKALSKDPARPKVAPFGRGLYYIDLPIFLACGATGPIQLNCRNLRFSVRTGPQLRTKNRCVERQDQMQTAYATAHSELWS